MREVIKTAATVEEAINLALTELGLTRDQVTCEVLQYPEKKFFFKKTPAKVKVCEIEEEISLKDLFAEEKKEQPKQVQKHKKEQPKKEAVKETAKETAKEVAKAPVKESVKEVRAEVKQEEVAEKEEIVEETPVQVVEEELSDKAKYAVEFLRSIVDQFQKGSYELNAVKTENGYTIEISGEDVGALIGRKGETMEALSYLTSLAANRSDDSFEKITVDVANYRQKREKDLMSAAKKAANKVLKSGRPYGFEPMNPYDRRIIHMVIGEIEGVNSESKGEGSSRRVIVYSTNPRPHNKGGKKPYNKNNKNRKEKEATQVQKTRDEKLVDESSFGLYSKIEI